MTTASTLHALRASVLARAAAAFAILACAPAAGGGAGNRPTVAPLAFRVGETLTYRLYWGLIPVGTGQLSTKWADRDGRRLIALVATAKTGPVVATLYPVDDVIESLVDPVTFLPVEVSQNLRQGWERKRDVTVFDHASRKAKWRSLLTGDEREIEIAEDTRDALCVVYHMRSAGLEPGQTVSFRVLVDNKLYDLMVEGQGIEPVRVPACGSRDCLRVEPLARFGQIFIRRGRMNFWFTRDRERVCTLVTGQIPLVSVRAVLTGAAGPGMKEWASKR